MIALVGWAVVAVGLRLAVSWACASSGAFADMWQYHERAVHLVTTGTLFPDALRGPGYPALLAAAYAVDGVSLWSARVANALVGGLLTIVTGWLAVKAGAGTRAWIAAAIVAVYPALVLSAVYPMPDSFYGTLAAITLLLMRHRSLGFALAAGVVAGAAILTRSVGLSLVAAAVALALWDVAWARTPVRAAGVRVAVFTGACLVVLAPWLMFTTRVAGGPLLDATSGMNVLLGNHDTATGRLSFDDDAPLRKAHVDGAASIADGNSRALKAGMRWAWEHPGAWTRVALKKLGYLFGLEGREHAWAYGLGYFGPRATWAVTLWGVLLIASFPLLVVAAAWGVARSMVPWDRVHVAMAAFLVATAALHVSSFGESRFHLPLVPVFAVAASLATGVRPHAAAAIGRGGRLARVVGAAAVVLVLAVAWATQIGELSRALTRLRAPDGAQSAIPY